MSRKKRKRRSNPEEICRSVSLTPGLEPVARELHKKACCGSIELWPKLANCGGIANAPSDLKHSFLLQSNQGMREAQQDIINIVTRTVDPSPSEIILCRSIADSIAWQFLGNQLCHARVLYKEQKPPSLKHSNFESVLVACNKIVEDHPDSVPLISDLTSFIQVGDILASIPGMPLKIVEVKEGKHNHTLLEVMTKAGRGEISEADVIKLIKDSNQKTIEQLLRMSRQIDRASHVTELMSSGQSIDPDTSYTHQIPEKEVPIGSWSEDVNSLIKEAHGKGWSIGIVDDCLFLGVYSNPKVIQAAHIAFNAWFDSCGATMQCPRGTLIDSIRMPLALPPFNQDLPHESMFDTLFGRLHVCIGVNIKALVMACIRNGIEVRSGTKRETSRAQQMKLEPLIFENRSVFMKAQGREVQISQGIFLRMMFHSQRPISLIKAILDNFPD